MVGALMTHSNAWRPDRTVVIVGLMGAGKSTVGRRLAARLEVPFIDADAEIEKAAGCSIEDIFEVHGEAAFRAGERRVIARLLDGPVHVLATGGGAYMDSSTRQRIREKGVSVWLRAELDLLVRRTARRDHRPLLKDRDQHQVLGQLIAERYPIYAEADVIVDSGDGPHEIVVQKILSGLSEWRAAGEAPERAGATS